MTEAEEEDTAQPLINPITSSAGSTFVEGTETTFTTKVSDNAVLAKIEMYIGSELVETVNHNDTTPEAIYITHTTSTLAVGTHTVTVKA